MSGRGIFPPWPSTRRDPAQKPRRLQKKSEGRPLFVGIAIASRGRVFGPRLAQSRKIKDDCWACSKPVYEGETAVAYLGLWFHMDCYHSEIVFQQSAYPDHRDPAE